MIHNFVLFLSISGGEILLIVMVVYLVFGPKKIPELARMLGKGMNELRRATDDIKKEITKETGNIKKDMDIGIDLKDPLNIKNSGKSKSTAEKTADDKSTPKKEVVDEDKDDTTKDKQESKSPESEDNQVPKGSVPRS